MTEQHYIHKRFPYYLRTCKYCKESYKSSRRMSKVCADCDNGHYKKTKIMVGARA